MQIVSNEMLELEDQLILQGEDEDEHTLEQSFDDADAVNVKNNNGVDESMTWSLLNEDEVKQDQYEDENEDEDGVEDDVEDDDQKEMIDEEEVSEDHRSILPVDSCDSIPSNYDMSTDIHQHNDNFAATTRNNDDIFRTDRFEHSTTTKITVNRGLEQNIEGEKYSSSSFRNNIKTLHDLFNRVPPSWMIALAWFVTLSSTTYFARQSSLQAYKIKNLQEEITSLQQTISELRQNQTDNQAAAAPGWFAQSSAMMKEWATAVVDVDINDFSFSQQQRNCFNESTFLDIFPNEAIVAVKNFSTNIATIVSDVFDDVGTNTKDVFTTVGESVTSFSETLSSVETVTEKIQNISVTVFDIIDSQKYALIFGALYYQVYENFFNDLAVESGF